jgi:hypothetical protein
MLVLGANAAPVPDTERFVVGSGISGQVFGFLPQIQCPSAPIFAPVVELGRRLEGICLGKKS